MTKTEEDDQSLTRTQRRLLRRIYNGRTVPINADGRAFLTYRDASQYLQSLSPEARDAAYTEMKADGMGKVTEMPPEHAAFQTPDTA